MNDEELIEFVRQHEVLYDFSHPKYMDVNFKNDIWNEIGKRVDAEGLICKARWTNIRDTYRKSLRKSGNKNWHSPRGVKLYKYSEQLSFLNKYFDERKSMCIFENTEIKKEYETQQQEPEEDTQNDGEESVPQEPAIILSSQINQPSSSTTQKNHEPSYQVPKSKSFRVQKQKSPKKLEFPQNAVVKLLDYILTNDNNPASCLKLHPVDAFLAGLAPTLKACSPYDWHLAKSDLFAIVQKYELKTIMKQYSNKKYGLNNMTSRPQQTPLSTPSSSLSSAPPSPEERVDEPQ